MHVTRAIFTVLFARRFVACRRVDDTSSDDRRSSAYLVKQASRLPPDSRNRSREGADAPGWGAVPADPAATSPIMDPSSPKGRKTQDALHRRAVRLTDDRLR